MNTNNIKAFFTFVPLMVTVASFGQKNNSSDSASELILRTDSIHQMKVEVSENGTYSILTAGNDPWILTQPLSQQIDGKANVLSFEYFCPKGIDQLQVFFCPPFNNEFSKVVPQMGVAEGWVNFSVDLSEMIYDWGKPGDFLRLDFRTKADVNLQIRNLRLRPMTSGEMEMAAKREEKKLREAEMEKNLTTYLDTIFNSKIISVQVLDSLIVISGELSGIESAALCESAPWQDVTENGFEKVLTVNGRQFEVKAPRFAKRNGNNYDRLLSRWILADAKNENLISHARYPDTIVTANDLPKEVAASRKGLGGFSSDRAHIDDLDSLDITSATVNIWITHFMYSKPSVSRLEHSYNGKSYYFDKKAVAGFDSTFRTTARKNIVTAAILLIDKIENSADQEIGRLLQHPDMDPAGIYSMPNFTNQAGVDCYAAALDFLASRYSRPDKKYGRCNHWIMHNEVDAGWVWTNMGDKTALIFMDTYLKSMRMCYAIARSYNPHSEVFITLTHYWAWTSHPKFYPSKDLMKILIDYSRVEGDFQWAVAQHPYPEDLFEPKTWLDPKVTFDFNTPLITFKNLEVLNAWIKLPEVLYKGTTKRTLWLSENGTNSRTYSEQDLKEQAAGFAYTWKKMKNLDAIDGFQWHNWFDHRGEGGLRIGLRRFPDDEAEPGGRKPVWYVFQAADRKNEDEVFDQYKPVIGINDWNDANYLGEIDAAKRQKTYRNIQSDTWIATDALGRNLPGIDECGTVKNDRFAGMFYFMTHTSHDGNGPWDVTKIISENPENPNWGKGSHFWGEPEIGYYLNQDEWAIRRHAYQLADAGIDVIIFDVTNDITFPEVYLKVCKVFREMRAVGEKTPDIAFLGSEISVNKLWNEFYKKAMFPDLWFMWKGKPLLLFGQHEIPGRKKNNDVVFAEEINNFFSIRQSWAWTSLPWYQSCPFGKDKWPWVDHFPQAVGWHDSPDEKEMVPVAVAQHPLSNIGRSFYNFHQPPVDKYDLTPFTNQGLFFQEQWNHALEVDPKFIFITGWNEWSAGAQTMGENINKELQKWNFYPGAHLGKAGKELKPGDHYFIDQYNQEFSRDIEPMKGGHTDNYYYQLMANIRRYKGVSKPVQPGERKTIDIAGSFEQWNQIASVYYDHIGDTKNRNEQGEGSAGPFINDTGRNDISVLKVARDDKNVFFYAETVKELTPASDKNWMLLYIDIDQNKSTGWEGYDYVINSKVLSSSNTTTLTKLDKNGTLGKSTKIQLQTKGNKLMLAIPRTIFGESAKVAFDFHWADNIQKLGSIDEFFNNGDSAPERRANYRFEE